MKSIKFLNAILFISIVYASKLNGQATIASNVGTALDYLGHSNNFPQIFRTSLVQRMQINHIITSPTTFAAGNIIKDGFVGINTADPWSRLHIATNNANPYGGYRPWMREGLTLQSFNDQLWLGLTTWGAVDQQNSMINWGDDGAGTNGPDHLVFNYTFSSQAGAYPAPGIVPNPQTLNGMDVMRLTDLGRVGIGPRFNNAIIPQSTLHQHQENSQPTWMQISNQFSGGTAASIVPTAIAATDGLRFGIDGNNNAYMFNQENRHLIFSSNALTTNLTQERFRITAINTPGTPNPGALANNLTRVSISQDPLFPVDQPVSLLHLGYNLISPGSTFGYRSWMDVGMTVSRANDHVFLGLMPPVVVNGRTDAVLAWGDDFVGSPTRPDRLRIIFTSPLTGQPNAGPGAMQLQNGLEFMRFFPNVLGGNPDPRVGLGDFFSLVADPLNTFEINTTLGGPLANNAIVPGSWPTSTGVSGLRFRDLTSASTPVPNGVGGVINSKLLTVDQNGDVVLTDAPIGNANNGLSVTGGVIQLGAICPATPAQITAAQLLNDRLIPLNNNNLTFYGQGTAGENRVLIGVLPNCAPGNKLEVDNGTAPNPLSGLRLTDLTGATPFATNPGPGVLAVDPLNGDVIYVPSGGGGTSPGNLCGALANPITGNFEVPLGAPVAFNYYFTGQNLANHKVSVGFPCNTVLRGRFNSLQLFPAPHAQETISGYFLNSDINGVNQDTLVGVFGEANGIQPLVDNTNIGGSFYGMHARTNIGVQGIGRNTVAQPIPATSCFGGRFIGASATGNNYGVWATAAGPGVNYAGFFQGDVFVNGGANSGTGYLVASDQQFKNNIDSINNAMGIIKQLKPRTFLFDTANVYNINFSDKKQYGLIAQDVQSILPELVGNVTKPAEIDEYGNVIAPAVTYKNLNYNAFIAILLKGMQEQQKTIDSLTTKTSKQDSINNAVQAQIAALTSSVSSCCSSSAVRTTKPEELNQLDIKLSDKDIIVLNQNVPNPFAEQTTITYNVPEKYNFAQIIFSTIEGKIIKAVDITKKGKGQLNVFANDLSSGMYTYSLVVDGKVMDTKKMVKSE